MTAKEALDRIRNRFGEWAINNIKEFEVLEQALKRLEAIESVDGGEVLKALQSLTKKGVENSKKGYLDIDNEWNTINNFILKSQAQEKELEECRNIIGEILGKYTNVIEGDDFVVIINEKRWLRKRYKKGKVPSNLELYKIFIVGEKDE